MLILKKTDIERSLTISHDLVGDVRLTLPLELPPDSHSVDHPDNKEVVSAAMLLHFVWMFLHDVGSDNIDGAATAALGVVETLDHILKNTTATA